MQRRLGWVALFTLAIVVASLYQARKVRATSIQAFPQGCSVASLKGTYAFIRTGVNNGAGGPIAQIGTSFYDGAGTRGLIRTTRSTNGTIRDWTDTLDNGTYTLDPDCTGSFFDDTGAKTENFVVLDGGRRYLLLSFATGTIVSEEGTKMEEGK
jgi:hypothetical protein